MRTTFLKIAAILFMINAVSKSFTANSENHDGFRDLTWINNFYKVKVHGDIQFRLLSHEKSSIETNAIYYDALIQVEKFVLHITCYRSNRLNVWVTVNNLRYVNITKSFIN